MFGRLLAVSILAAVLAALQVGLGSFFPVWLSLVSPAMAFCLWLVMDAELTDVMTAAVAAGLIFDCASSMPFGLHTLALVIVLLLAEALFTNVFTNQSMAAAMGLQTVTFLAFRVLWGGFLAVRYVSFGWSWSNLAWIGGWSALIFGLVFQLITVASVFWLGRRLTQLVSSTLMVASRPSRS